MARIRSVHPGQWSDEDFVECSFPARLLALALRNEADDQGVFEWKPAGLKMRLMPADAIDIGKLLSELETRNIIRRFEYEDRSYGAIRNFRKYQRPKVPNSTHHLPTELREYVCLKTVETGNEPPVSDDDFGNPPPVTEPDFPQKEKTPEQMEEEGGRRKEVKKNNIGASAPTDELFDRFWEAYPKRKGGNPSTPAKRKFAAAVTRGIDPEMLIAAARAYDRSLGDKAGTEFVCQAKTWLNEERWNDHPPEDAAKPIVVPECWQNGFAAIAARATRPHFARGWLYSCVPSIEAGRLILTAKTKFIADQLRSTYQGEVEKLWDGTVEIREAQRIADEVQA